MSDQKRAAPERFMLLKYGTIDYTQDDKQHYFRFDEPSADALIREFQNRQRDLVIDYEHATLSGDEAPAAGWIDGLEKTPEGLAAHVKYWTDKAKAHLEQGEYRYFSPVVFIARGGQTPCMLHSVALTNHPAVHGVPALVASDRTVNNRPEPGRQPRKGKRMKQELCDAIAKVLGGTPLALNDDAGELACAAQLTALADELPKLRERAAKADELEAAELEAKKLALFDKGAARKAFSNAQKPVLLRMALADLEELEKNTPDNAALPAKLPEPPGEEKKSAAALTDEEKEIAHKMGLTDEEFAAVKTQNKEDE